MSELTKWWVEEIYPTDAESDGITGTFAVYLAADVERVIAELISALRTLHDVQNGSPLPKYDRDWKAAMEDAERLLAEWEGKP